jgi:hypothetical protein
MLVEIGIEVEEELPSRPGVLFLRGAQLAFARFLKRACAKRIRPNEGEFQLLLGCQMWLVGKRREFISMS